MEKIQLSTVTPVYQGEDYLRELVNKLQAVKTMLEHGSCPVVLTEAIFVDDGAIDGSAAVLAELGKEHRWLRVIHLSRNFGQHPATIAGILHSSGEWVATMDEDLQHPPERLMQLLEFAVTRGSDVVFANAEGAVHASAWRNLTSRLLKKILGSLSGNPHVEQFSSFRMLRGTVARAAAALAISETYLDVALCWFTSRIHALKLPLQDIRSGAGKRSGYGLSRLLRHARRMLTTSQIKALRGGVFIGLLALVGSFALIVHIFAARYIFKTEPIVVRGWASTMVGILFFGGLTSLLHGITLEYVSLLAQQTQGRPVFLVIDRGSDEILLDWIKQRGQDAHLAL